MDEIKTAEQFKREFLHRISHELRTPLTVAKEGLAQLIDGLQGDIPGEQKRQLAMISRAIDQLSRVVDELLTLASIEGGTFFLNRELVDLRDLVREILRNLRPEVARKGIQIADVLPQASVPIYMDRGKIQQAISQILGTLIRHASGARMEVSVAETEASVECRVAVKSEEISESEFAGPLGKLAGARASVEDYSDPAGRESALAKELLKTHAGTVQIQGETGKRERTIVLSLPRLSPREVVREYVMHSVSAAGAGQTIISVICFEVHSWKTLGVERGEEWCETLRGRMDGVLKGGLRRFMDKTMQDGSRIWIVLPATAKVHADSVSMRLCRLVAEFLVSEPSFGKIEFHCKVVALPDAAATVDQLLSKIDAKKAQTIF